MEADLVSRLKCGLLIHEKAVGGGYQVEFRVDLGYRIWVEPTVETVGRTTTLGKKRTQPKATIVFDVDARTTQKSSMARVDGAQEAGERHNHIVAHGDDYCRDLGLHGSCHVHNDPPAPPRLEDEDDPMWRSGGEDAW